MSFDYPEKPLKPFQNPEQDQEQADARECDIVFADDNELQFALGSDARRECYSVRKALAGIEKPTCFFEPKMF